jgi:hypothetical protein
MSRFAAALVLSLAFVTAAHAKEKEGVQIPDTVEVDGKTLKLNGAGVRTKIFFKVYVAGLYLEDTTKSAQEAISADGTKRVTLVLLRDLDKNQVSEAIREGFQKNTTNMAALKDRLDKLSGMFSDVKKGQQMVLTYVPGKGTTVAVNGTEKGTIEGKDFNDALLAVWLGKQPVDEDCKKGMLGQ